MSRIVPLGLALVLASCAQDGTPRAVASGSLAAARDGSAVYTVNVDEGTISRLGTGAMDHAELPVGGEPTRIAVGGERIFVTLRAERSLVALTDDGGLRELDRTEVGAEPYGVVATADGSRVYVAVSLEDKVRELDGATLELLREWDVMDEPRWLALSADEDTLFVASHRDGRVTRIDLESGGSSRVPLPGAGTKHPLDDGKNDTFVDGPPFDLDVTVTGDPAVSPDGGTLVVPVVYADTETPVDDTPGKGGGSGYATVGGVEVGRMNPAVVLLPLDEDVPVEDEGRPVFAGVRGERETLRSSLTAASFDPSGRYVLATMESSDAVIVIDTEPFRGQGDAPARPSGRRDESFSTLPLFGFLERPVTALATSQGPRGVAVVDDTLFVHGFLDRTIGSTVLEDALEVNRNTARERDEDGRDPVLGLTAETRLGPSALTAEVKQGRKLFWSATDRTMTARGGGVACVSCHVDGRTDGRTWTFADTTLQTPSLAGGVSETTPFTWDGTVKSVGQEAELTSTLRMGGHGPDDEQLASIEAFLDSVRAPDVPDKGRQDDLVARGKELFERADVGCAECHSGDRHTDNRNHLVLGDTPTNTPTLTSIAASAPYLHDGSLPDLRSVLVWARGGAMGDTSMLDDDDLDALEAYLRSL